jgi:AcrR family transcriptional regulator
LPGVPGDGGTGGISLGEIDHVTSKMRGKGGGAGAGAPQGEPGPRQRILDAALDIVEAEGIAALTQPKVAKAVGLRQSHITYYFPRKADLVIGLLEASHGRAGRGRGARPGDVFALLSGLMFDRQRMLFFLGILMAVSDDAELREIFRAHADGLVGNLAGAFGVAPDDPALIAFVDELRGAGIRRLITKDSTTPDIAAIAARHGLRLEATGGSASGSRSRSPRRKER